MYASNDPTRYIWNIEKRRVQTLGVSATVPLSARQCPTYLERRGTGCMHLAHHGNYRNIVHAINFMYTEITVVVSLFLVIWASLSKGTHETFFPQSNFVPQKAFDGRTYLVQKSVHQLQVANMLARLAQNMEELIRALETRRETLPPFMQSALSRLQGKFSAEILREAVTDAKYTSYSLNKEEIHFCVRSRDGTDSIYDTNLMMYVCLHECSHLASSSQGHTQEFGQIFSFLVHEAAALGLYRPIDFKRFPAQYCGLVLNS